MRNPIANQMSELLFSSSRILNSLNKKNKHHNTDLSSVAEVIRVSLDELNMRHGLKITLVNTHRDVAITLRKADGTF